MHSTLVILFAITLILIPTTVYAEFVFKDIEAFGQNFDISQLMGEKVVFEFGDNTYDVYYGYGGSLDSVGTDFLEPELSSMKINEERKSIEITMSSVPEKTEFWVRIPEDVLYAENEQFVVLVDGIETEYVMIKYPNDSGVGMIISEDTKNIEIIGTKVIPEFGFFAIVILGISVLGILFLTKSPMSKSWNKFN